MPRLLNKHFGRLPTAAELPKGVRVVACAAAFLGYDLRILRAGETLERDEGICTSSLNGRAKVIRAAWRHCGPGAVRKGVRS